MLPLLNNSARLPMPEPNSTKPFGRLVRVAGRSSGPEDENVRLESRPSPVLLIILAASVSLLTLVLVVAASTVKIQQVVKIPGKLVTRRNTQVLSPPGQGVVKDVLVKGGEKVSAGQALVILDPKVQASDVNELSRQLLLEASRRDAEISQITDKIAGLKRQEELDMKILVPLQELAAKGAASESQVLRQQKVLEKTRRDLSEAIKGQRKLQFESEKTQSQLQQDLVGAETSLELVTVKAPVNGTIIDLEAQTGQVVGMGTELMRLVPTDELQANVFAPNKDLAFITPGQTADVTLDAYSETIYGFIDAKVVSVSEDALPPDQIYQYPHFPVKLELSQQYLEKNGQRFALQPGMSVNAKINLQKLTFVQLFFSRFNSRLDSVREMR